MPTLISLALTAALLAAAPSPGDEGSGPPDIQVFAAAATVLGAATGCDKIDREQVSAAASQVGALATAKVLSVEEAVSIERVLIVSAAAGLQALKDGKTDCKTVEASFNQLQQLVLQTPVALKR